MERMSRRIVAVVLALAASLAHAQPAWPSRTIRVIVPFSAGSGTDTASRPVLAEMSKLLGQSIVVENRPGAGGTIGMQAVAQAEPDGYTLLVHSNSFTVVSSTYAKLPFDPVKDFVGVMPIASLPMALVTSPDKGYRTLKDLVGAARARPGSVTYASAGAGGATHLGAERFRAAAGFEGVHVPYKGSAEALTDVMAGRVDYYFSPVGLALQHVRTGRLAALGVVSSKRSTALPDVPTTVEAGLPDSDYDVWVGMWAPAKTPPAIVAKLNEVMTQALRSPEVVETFRRIVADPMPMSPAQFAEQVRRETAMNAALVKAAGVTAN
jgi:tripartite-type tricarboxylate transporter receptor subunit TctC